MEKNTFASARSLKGTRRSLCLGQRSCRYFSGPLDTPSIGYHPPASRIVLKMRRWFHTQDFPA
jgi:hypothetical protein